MVFYDLQGKGIPLFSFFIFVILFLPLISSVQDIKVGIDSNPQPIINDNSSTGLNIGIDAGKINYYRYTFNSTNITTITYTGVNSYNNIALTNQSAIWDAGTNVSVGDGGWFNGAFDWVIDPLSERFTTFNGTTLWIDDEYFFNGWYDSGTSVYLNDITEEVIIGGVVPSLYDLTVINGTYIGTTGIGGSGIVLKKSDVNGNNMITVETGLLSAPLEISSDVGGLFLEPDKYVGVSIGSRFKSPLALHVNGSVNVTDNLFVNNTLVNTWLYNQTQSAYFYNMTINFGSYNETYNAWLSYNQTTGAIDIANTKFLLQGTNNTIKLDINNITNFLYNYNQTQSAYFYNMTQSAYFYNMSVNFGSYNATYDAHVNNLTQHNNTYWYNQTQSAYFYNMSLYADNFIKNGTYPWFRYLNVSGEIVTGNINISGAGGRVGIGTTAPSSTLSVAGNISTTGMFISTGNPYFQKVAASTALVQVLNYFNRKYHAGGWFKVCTVNMTQAVAWEDFITTINAQEISVYTDNIGGAAQATIFFSKDAAGNIQTPRFTKQRQIYDNAASRNFNIQLINVTNADFEIQVYGDYFADAFVDVQYLDWSNLAGLIMNCSVFGTVGSTGTSTAVNSNTIIDYKLGIGTTAPAYLLETAVSPIGANLSGVLYVNGTNGYVGIGTAKPTQRLEVVGNVNVTGNVVLGIDSSNTATVIGYMGVNGADPDAAYGILVKQGTYGTYAGYFDGQVYVTLNVSAQGFIDRSSWCNMPEEDVLTSLMNIKSKTDEFGKITGIDKDTLPDCAVAQTETTDAEGNQIIEKGRDIGAYISYLTIVNQEQQKKIIELEGNDKKINDCITNSKDFEELKLCSK